MSENSQNLQYPERPEAPKCVEISAFARDLDTLKQHGYCAVLDRPSQPGQYRVVDQDIAPGWGEYWYTVEVCEHPDQPLRLLGWRN